MPHVNEALAQTINDNWNISLEERLKDSYKSEKYELYPHEILMVAYSARYRLNREDYPGFWKYKYSVDDPAGLMDSLIDRGFVCIGSYKDAVSKLRVNDLKELLSAKNIVAKGKKAELVSLVQEHYGEEELQSFVNPGLKPTEKGQDLLNLNWYVAFCHDCSIHTEINAWSINRRLKGKSCTCFEQLDEILQPKFPDFELLRCSSIF